MVTSSTARSGGSSRDPVPAEDPTLSNQKSVKKMQNNANAQRRIAETKQARVRKEALGIATDLKNGVGSGQLAWARYQMFRDGGFRFEAHSMSAARDDHAQARVIPRPGPNQTRRPRQGTPRRDQIQVSNSRDGGHQSTDDDGTTSQPSSDRRCVAPDASTSVPLRAPSVAQVPNGKSTQLVHVSQTPHVTSGEDDDAVATLRAATGLATPVIKDVLSRSGGFVEVAGDRAMREQEERHDRERAREVQLQFDRAAIEPVQAETFTQVPLRANTRGASAGPPEQRPTSTKGNFSSSGSAPTAGGEQSSVTQTTTQPQRDEPGRGGRGGRGDGGHGGTSHHGEPGGGRGGRGGGGRGGVDQRGGGGQRGGKPKASRGGGPVTRGGDG